MKTILFAVDPEELAESAVPVVASLALHTAAEVLVLNVRDHNRQRGSWRDSRELVEAVAAELRAAGVSARSEVVHIHDGHTARAIAGAARQSKAFLVAAGCHGHSEAGALLLGSVTRELAAELSCPLLVVRRQPGSDQLETAAVPAEIRRILLAIDGRPESEPAITAATVLALALGAALTVVNVLPSEWGHEIPGSAPEQDGEPLVALVAARLRNHGIAVSTAVVRAAPSTAGAIGRAAEAHLADLVVVGCRRLGRLDGLLRPSVSGEVVHTTRTPVLVAGGPGSIGG